MIIWVKLYSLQVFSFLQKQFKTNGNNMPSLCLTQFIAQNSISILGSMEIEH